MERGGADGIDTPGNVTNGEKDLPGKEQADAAKNDRRDDRGKDEDGLQIGEEVLSKGMDGRDDDDVVAAGSLIPDAGIKPEVTSG